MYEAYFDRVTDNGKALLLIDKLQKEFHVEMNMLPDNTSAGTWYLVEIQNDIITSIQTDVEKTKSISTEIGSSMERLKSKQTSRFKRK